MQSSTTLESHNNTAALLELLLQALYKSKNALKLYMATTL